jgi:hypothetical protein
MSTDSLSWIGASLAKSLDLTQQDLEAYRPIAANYSSWPYLDLVKEERELIFLNKTSTNPEYKRFIKFKLAKVIAELDSRLK